MVTYLSECCFAEWLRSRCSSIHAATSRRCSSRSIWPISCRPTGRESDGTGIEMAGWPVRFASGRLAVERSRTPIELSSAWSGRRILPASYRLALLVLDATGCRTGAEGSTRRATPDAKHSRVSSQRMCYFVLAHRLSHRTAREHRGEHGAPGTPPKTRGVRDILIRSACERDTGKIGALLDSRVTSVVGCRPADAFELSLIHI